MHPCRSSFRGNKIQAELDRSTINLRRVAGRRASSGANGFPPRSTSREACLLCILHCVAHVIGGSHRQNVKTPVWQRWRRRRLAWRVAISLHPRREESRMQGARELKLASNMRLDDLVLFKSSENSALKTSRSENKRPRNRPHDSVTEISPPSPSSWQVKSASTNHEHQLPWHHFSQLENDPILNALPRYISSNNHTDESPIIAVNYSCLLIPMCVVAWWYWTRRKARAVVSGLLHHSSQESESEEFDDFSTW